MSEQPHKKLLVIWRPRANAQWNKILTFFAKRNRSIEYSLKLDAELDNVLDILSAHPELGQETKRKKTRRHTFENYAVFYRVRGETLEVTALVDVRQDRRLD